MNSVRALAQDGAPNNRTTRRTAQFRGGWRGAAVGRSSPSPHRRISEAPWADSFAGDGGCRPVVPAGYVAGRSVVGPRSIVSSRPHFWTLHDTQAAAGRECHRSPRPRPAACLRLKLFAPYSRRLPRLLGGAFRRSPYPESQRCARDHRDPSGSPTSTSPGMDASPSRLRCDHSRGRALRLANHRHTTRRLPRRLGATLHRLRTCRPSSTHALRRQESAVQFLASRGCAVQQGIAAARITRSVEFLHGQAHDQRSTGFASVHVDIPGT
jgi:hypothetical protein